VDSGADAPLDSGVWLVAMGPEEAGGNYFVKYILLSLCLMFALTAYAPNVGETSKVWKVVITPCAWCGATNNIEVHHIIPQAECKRIGRPDLIYNTNNMVCLCRGKDGKGCHYYIGHHGRGWTNIFTNVMAVIKAGEIKGE